MTQEQDKERAQLAAPPMQGEMKIIQEAIDRVGIKSLLNHGAGSLVWSEGVEGVTQDDLLAYTREVALHCAVALAAPQPNAALADEEQKDLFAVALFLSSRNDPTCILKDEDAERAIGLLLRLSGFELNVPPTLNASKEQQP